MSGLPWVRLDSNIASHDKIIELLSDRGATKGDRFQAAFSYVCSMGYSGGHGTDGLVKFNALPWIHATRRTAELAVEHGLWTPHPQGWTLPGWAARQPTVDVTEARRAAQSKGAQKANCRRFHGPDCGCWENQ